MLRSGGLQPGAFVDEDNHIILIGRRLRSFYDRVRRPRCHPEQSEGPAFRPFRGLRSGGLQAGVRVAASLPAAGGPARRRQVYLAIPSSPSNKQIEKM
jgi:hypothetical protein